MMGVSLATPCGNCTHPYNTHLQYRTPNGGIENRCLDFDSNPCHWGHSRYCEHQDSPYFANFPGGSVTGESPRESQVGGDHYRKYKIQPWDIWQEYGLDGFTAAIIKYLLRDKGNRLEDLRKARHTLDRLIEIEEGKSGER